MRTIGSRRADNPWLWWPRTPHDPGLGVINLWLLKEIRNVDRAMGPLPRRDQPARSAELSGRGKLRPTGWPAVDRWGLDAAPRRRRDGGRVHNQGVAAGHQ